MLSWHCLWACLVIWYVPSDERASERVSTQLPTALSKYYHFTNRASRAIYNNAFAEASMHYDSAFLYKQHPFYVDLKNYVLVNHKHGAYSKNEKVIRQLIVDKRIARERLFLDLPRRVWSVENLALLEDPNIKVSRLSAMEVMWRQELQKMFEMDQASLADDEEKLLDYEKSKQQRDSLVDVNFIQFKKYCNTYGFPGEDRIGVFYDDEYEWAYVLSSLLHNFIDRDHPQRNEDLKVIIENALYAGELHHALAASLLDFIHSYSRASPLEQRFMNSTICTVTDVLHKPFVFYSDSLMRVVNANRTSIGLDSFHITQKQVVCQWVGSKTLDDQAMITMVPYVEVHALPAGMVRQAAADVQVNLADYKINTAKVLNECYCEWKGY